MVDKGKLVGIVTKHDLLEASPSPATSLSVYELNYLLAKMKVKDIMKKNPVTVGPDTPFEEALKIGQEKKVGSFPVVERREIGGDCDRIGHCPGPDPRSWSEGGRFKNHDRRSGKKLGELREDHFHCG